MYTPKKLIEHLSSYIEEINNLLLEKVEEIENIEKLNSDKNRIEQYIEKLKSLPENHKLSSDEIKKNLALSDHPEGGYFLEFIRTKDYTVIFYLLPKGNVSTWHAMKGIQETFKLISGDSLFIPSIHSDGNWQTEEQLTYTNDAIIKKDKNNQFGVWFGAYPNGNYSLVTCRCVPAFQYENFKLVDKNDLAVFSQKNPANIAIINKLAPAHATVNTSTFFPKENITSSTNTTNEPIPSSPIISK